MTRMMVALITLGDPGRLTGGYLYHRRLAEAAERHAARLEFVSFPDRLFPLAALAAPAIVRQAERLGADALVLDSIAAAFMGPLLALRQTRAPLIAILHQPPGGIDHGPARAFVQAWLDRLAYRRARLLLLASESLAEQVVIRGVRSKVVPPGRDVSSEVGPSPGDLRRGRRVAFLCVGNWVERKGILSLLDAFAAIPDDLATLHLVGDDRADAGYAQRVRTRLARPDLRERALAHGPLPLPAVAAFYDAADGFVLPSLKEPYGTVYGEAMTAGLPVVGWRAGNLPYLAEHEREGLILPPGDIPGLTRALTRLAHDETLRQRLGAAGRGRALTRPTWEQSAELFYGVIREVVEQTGLERP